MGLVKNRRNNGDHYWVSAFVTPIFDGERLVGYESVRISATPSEKARAEAMYRRIRQGNHHALPGTRFRLWGPA